MTQETADRIMVSLVVLASGHAGFYARGVWDEYRMRRVLRRIHETVNQRGKVEA